MKQKKYYYKKYKISNLIIVKIGLNYANII